MIFRLLTGDSFINWLEKLGKTYDERRAANEGQQTERSTSADDPITQLPNYPTTHVYPRVERAAMGSLFEIYLAGTDRESLVGAANQALDDIERLDRQLSHYKDDSDVARLNRHAPEQWVRVEPQLYHLLKRCAELNASTGRAFDITTGPLTKAWGFYRGEGRVPPDEEIDSILQRVGMQRILFEDSDDLVYYTAPGLEIDFGAIGKGYAIDQAAMTLQFYGVNSAVIHGGQSTIYAMGIPPVDLDGETGRGRDGEIGRPGNNEGNPQPSTELGWQFTIKDPRDHETPIQTVYLRDQALSTSGSYEQFFEQDGIKYSHILDPRTGRPVSGMLSVSVIAPSAADSDALSTAFFVMGRERTEEFCRNRPDIKVILMEEKDEEELRITRLGF